VTRLPAIGVALLLVAASVAAAGTAPVPTPIGTGPMFHPGASNSAVALGLPIGPLACRARDVPRAGLHLELFARGRVVIVPAGIGVAPPIRTRGVYVIAGRCTYPARTREPTGVIEIDRSTSMTLGDFFSVWGRPLTARRLLDFRALPDEMVHAYVNGRRQRGDPRSIRLYRHAEIVLEIESSIPPHATYGFPKGL
jgi:hypothetical protein